MYLIARKLNLNLNLNLNLAWNLKLKLTLKLNMNLTKTHGPGLVPAPEFVQDLRSSPDQVLSPNLNPSEFPNFTDH